MVMSRDQNAGQNGNTHIVNKSLETVEQFEYLGTTVTNQNSIHEEIKSRLKSENACCHSALNLLSSSFISKSVKINTYRNIILPAVLYGCETWSLTVEKEGRLRGFENRVLRRIFRPKRNEVTGEWKRLHNKELYGLYSSPDIIRGIKSRRMIWAEHVTRMGERRGAYKVLVGKTKRSRSIRRPRCKREHNYKLILEK
jgi:hypothetical protein